MRSSAIIMGERGCTVVAAAVVVAQLLLELLALLLEPLGLASDLLLELLLGRQVLVVLVLVLLRRLLLLLAALALAADGQQRHIERAFRLGLGLLGLVVVVGVAAALVVAALLLLLRRLVERMIDSYRASQYLRHALDARQHMCAALSARDGGPTLAPTRLSTASIVLLWSSYLIHAYPIDLPVSRSRFRWIFSISPNLSPSSQSPTSIRSIRSRSQCRCRSRERTYCEKIQTTSPSVRFIGRDPAYIHALVYRLYSTISMSAPAPAPRSASASASEVPSTWHATMHRPRYRARLLAH